MGSKGSLRSLPSESLRGSIRRRLSEGVSEVVSKGGLPRESLIAKESICGLSKGVSKGLCEGVYKVVSKGVSKDSIESL